MKKMDHETLQTQLSTILSLAKVERTDPNFVGIFLYGSQNYRLDNSSSDIDVIILIKSANLSKQELSTFFGKIKIYTLKYFIYRIKQGDMECYEILYTKHNIINSIYEQIIQQFVQQFTQCMNYERIKFSLCQKLNEHLCHVLWIPNNSENARYNKKRLYWAIRVCNQLQRINDGESFASSLIYRDNNEYDLRKIKSTTNYLSIKEFNEIYKYLVQFNYSTPRCYKAITDDEEKCLSGFYTAMAEIIKKEVDYFDNR